MNQKRSFYYCTPEKRKATTRMASSSRKNVTIVTSRGQTVVGTEIKMKIETKIIMQEIPASMGNAINAKKRGHRAVDCWMKKGKYK